MQFLISSKLTSRFRRQHCWKNVCEIRETLLLLIYNNLMKLFNNLFWRIEACRTNMATRACSRIFMLRAQFVDMRNCVTHNTFGVTVKFS